MINGQIVIHRVWRSQIKRLIVFILLCPITILVSRYVPQSVVTGKLFTIGTNTIYLSLPLLSLFHFGSLVALMLPIYDATFTIDSRGVEMESGILGLQLNLSRVRYEDIRGIDLQQSILERALNVGTIGIGSAATDGLEIVMSGIGSPREIQEMIQMERDARQRAEAQASRSTSFTQSAIGD